MFGLVVILLLFAGEFAYAQNIPAPKIPVPPTQIDTNRKDLTNTRKLVKPQVSQQQAVGIAKQRFAGSILRISLVGEGEKQRYQIRMENEGKIFTVFVNVATGRISGGG